MNDLNMGNIKNLADAELDTVNGGATVVEIKKDDGTVRCFSCGSDDVEVEEVGKYTSVKCRKCGSIDLRAE